MQRLSEHVGNGCLSDIPPQHCRPNPPSLYHQITTTVASSRLHIQTAHALLNSLLYAHNRKSTGAAVVPVWRLPEYNTVVDSVQVVGDGDVVGNEGEDGEV